MIIDEVQRRPELFAVMRSLVDARIRDGERTAQFLVLGSASRALLQQSSESLAGRIGYIELEPIGLQEWRAHDLAATQELRWLRGVPEAFWRTLTRQAGRGAVRFSRPILSGISLSLGFGFRRNKFAASGACWPMGRALHSTLPAWLPVLESAGRPCATTWTC